MRRPGDLVVEDHTTAAAKGTERTGQASGPNYVEQLEVAKDFGEVLLRIVAEFDDSLELLRCRLRVCCLNREEQ